MQQPGFLIHITTHCTLSNLGSFGKAPVAMISACGDDTGCHIQALAENTWAMMSACGDDTGGRLYRLVFTFLRFLLFAPSMDPQCIPISILHPFFRRFTAMRRTSIGNPENTSRRAVRLSPHRLIDQAMKWLNPSTPFASSDQFRSPDVPHRQISQCSLAFVLVFVTQGALGRWWQ